jgi:hypothetical protein
LSVSALLDSDFVFAFMPKIGDPTIDLDGGRYDIWIVPGSIARADALWVHQTYLDGRGRSEFLIRKRWDTG